MKKSKKDLPRSNNRTTRAATDSNEGKKSELLYPLCEPNGAKQRYLGVRNMSGRSRCPETLLNKKLKWWARHGLCSYRLSPPFASKFSCKSISSRVPDGPRQLIFSSGQRYLAQPRPRFLIFARIWDFIHPASPGHPRLFEACSGSPDETKMRETSSGPAVSARGRVVPHH
jgi:hypothetical protein